MKMLVVGFAIGAIPWVCALVGWWVSGISGDYEVMDDDRPARFRDGGLL